MCREDREYDNRSHLYETIVKEVPDLDPDTKHQDFDPKYLERLKDLVWKAKLWDQACQEGKVQHVTRPDVLERLAEEKRLEEDVRGAVETEK